MITIVYTGRLGNNLFQYAAAYVFAKKFGLSISSKKPDSIFQLQSSFEPKDSNAYFKKTIEVTDENFMSLLRMSRLEDANYRFIGYFQIKDFILEYENDIRSMFALNYKQQQMHDVFVAYRIGDIVNLRQMLPLQYYQEALTRLDAKSGYITSDSPNHQNVKILSEQFNLKVFQDAPDRTIDFAKNFNSLVLSEGSYSWWMGFLSNAKNIYYNERHRFWHGDIFVFPNWMSLTYDYK